MGAVGAGVHTGTAFVGAVGEGSYTDLTALGDPVKTTARLASAAAAGEILVTDAAAAAGALTTDDNGRYLDQSFDTCRLPTALGLPILTRPPRNSSAGVISSFGLTEKSGSVSNPGVAALIWPVAPIRSIAASTLRDSLTASEILMALETRVVPAVAVDRLT